MKNNFIHISDQEKFHKLCIKKNVGLNFYFAIKQDSTWEDIENIMKCHKKKDMFEKRLLKSIDSDDLSKVEHYLKKIVEWDLKVQKHWGFEEDLTKLTWINQLFQKHDYLSNKINKLRFFEDLKRS